MRALLEDQKKREAELLKQLIHIKNEAVEQPKIDVKLHNSITSDMQSKLEELVKQDNELKTSLETVQSNYVITQQNLWWYQNQYQALVVQISEYENLKNSLESQISHIASEMNSARKEIDFLKPELEKKEKLIRQLDEELRLVKTNLVDSLKSIDLYKTEVYKLKQLVDQLTQNNQKCIDELSFKIQQQSDELEKQRKIVDNLENITTNQDNELVRLQSIENDYLKLKMNFETMQTSHTDIIQNIEKLILEQSESAKQIQEKNDVISQYSEYLHQWQNVGQKYEMEIVDLKRQIEQSISIQTELTETQQKLKKCMDETISLQRDNENLNNKLADANNIQNQLQQRIIQIDNEASIKIQTFQQQLSMKDQELDSVKKQIIELREELISKVSESDEFHKVLEKKEEEISEMKSIMTTITEGKKCLETQAEILNNKVSDKDTEINNLKSQIAMLSEQDTTSRENLVDIGKKLATTENKLQETTDRLNQCINELTDNKNRNSNLNEDIDKLKAECNLRSKDLEMEKKRSDQIELDLQNQLKQAQSDLQIAVLNLEKWQVAGQEYEAKLSYCQMYVESMMLEKQQLETNTYRYNQIVVEMEDKNKMQIQTIEELNQKLADILRKHADERADDNIRVSRFESVLRNKDNDISLLREEIKRIEKRLSAIDSSHNNTTEELSKSVKGELRLREICSERDTELKVLTEHNLEVMRKISALESQLGETKLHEEQLIWMNNSYSQRVIELEQTVWWLQDQLQQWQYLANNDYEAKFSQVRSQLNGTTGSDVQKSNEYLAQQLSISQ